MEYIKNVINAILNKKVEVPVVKYVVNTNAKSHLEAKKYLLVKAPGMKPKLFNTAVVVIAETRATKNPEDLA